MYIATGICRWMGQIVTYRSTIRSPQCLSQSHHNRQCKVSSLSRRTQSVICADTNSTFTLRPANTSPPSSDITNVQFASPPSSATASRSQNPGTSDNDSIPAVTDRSQSIGAFGQQAEANDSAPPNYNTLPNIRRSLPVEKARFVPTNHSDD